MNKSSAKPERNPLQMVKDLAEVMRICDADPQEFIQHCLSIKTKDQQTVLLQLNTAQTMIYKRIKALRKAGKPIRMIILKARQEGVSTLCEAMIFERTARFENTNSLIVAHEPESTDAIFAMSKLFYDLLPMWAKPMRRYDNKKQMVFENPDEKSRAKDPGLRSRMVIATADKIKVGRGLTLHNFHGSEVAFWKNAKDLMLSVLQAIPNLPNTAVFLESTANGFGGDGEYFYKTVQDALAGKNEFELVFLPWHLMPEYSLAFTSDKQKETFAESLDEYETNLRKSAKLTLEQLNWRRWAIHNLCGGDIEKFKQEYPATIEESFVASSKGVIPKQYIEAQSKFTRAPIRMLDDILVYEEPNRNHFYSLGADPSEGVGQDDSAMTIIDKMTGREVGSYVGQIQPDLFAKKIKQAAEFFNNALAVVEINNHGLAVINALKGEYTNLYQRTVFDKVTNAKRKELGWKTSQVTKPLMVDDFIAGLRDEEIGLSSKTTVSQMMTFVHTSESNRYGMGAESGQKDDALISAMLAWQGLKELPSEMPGQRKGRSMKLY
jgi:hypothetical protein